MTTRNRERDEQRPSETLDRGRVERSDWPKWTAAVSLTLVTLFHYITEPSLVELHSVYRRLYYIPIVLFAFSYGLRGGLGSATFACLAYLPHAFLMPKGSPAPAHDKILEMTLYLAVGGLSGWLVQRQRNIQRALERSLEERDALEESLVRAGKLSALGQLTSGLAHEIRNPLASIMGSAEALVEEFDEDHRKYRLGQVMLREIDRLNKVVDDFLDFARPGEPERLEVELGDVIGEVVELTEAQARKRDVDIHVDVEDTFVEGDRDQLSQVVLNLVLNAYRAFEQTELPPEERTLRIWAEERVYGDQPYRCLGVRDTAGTLNPEEVDSIFDPYYTTRADGSGLGLSISSRIMEAHGGFLDVEPEAESTTFWMCMPTERTRS